METYIIELSCSFIIGDLARLVGWKVNSLWDGELKEDEFCMIRYVGRPKSVYTLNLSAARLEQIGDLFEVYGGWQLFQIFSLW